MVESYSESQYKASINNLNTDLSAPSARSLHTMICINKYLYLFGGYDGTRRTNDFYKYDIENYKWGKVVTNDIPPTPRERHVAISHDNCMFIFGGYDGINRLNDFYEFNTENNTWQEVIYSGSGLPPSPRHSACALVYEGNMYLYGGYDGSCKSELHRFNFETNTWSEIKRRTSNHNWPKERYRTSCALYKSMMCIYGGHDSVRQLNDFWLFDFKKMIWEEIKIKSNFKFNIIDNNSNTINTINNSNSISNFNCVNNYSTNNSFNNNNNNNNTTKDSSNIPCMRDSHITFCCKDSLFIHGGSSSNVYSSNSNGNFYVKSDLFEYNFNLSKWSLVKTYYIDDSNSMLVNQSFATLNININNNNNNNIKINSNNNKDINNIFCHSGVFVNYNSTYYTFGGSNGITRHNDFKSYIIKEDENAYINKNNKLHSISMDGFINNKKFSDVVLKLNNNEVIYGHKIMLSRIPYFDNLFNSGLKETFEKEINIACISSKIMLIIMKYIYTGKLIFDIDDSILLYEACNYLGLDDLNSACEEKIIFNCNTDNACFILIKAEEFNSIVLKEKILKFIVENFIDITLTNSFNVLIENKELALEVIRAYSLYVNSLKNKYSSIAHSSNSLIN